MPDHPFTWLSPAEQKRAFVRLLIMMLLVMIGLRILNAPLKTELSPSGIVSLELVGGLALAQRMLEAWGPKGQVYAGLSLGLDYLFMVTYASAISLGCVLVSRGLSGRVVLLAGASTFLAWAQFGAALLDAVENYALIRVLLGSWNEAWPVLARWCAIPKFLIVIVGRLYIISGTSVIVFQRLR